MNITKRFIRNVMDAVVQLLEHSIAQIAGVLIPLPYCEEDSVVGVATIFIVLCRNTIIMNKV